MAQLSLNKNYISVYDDVFSEGSCDKLIHFFETNKDKSKNIRNLLISIILRFTFSLCFLILIGILDIESYNLFIMNFFAFYLLYIIFEIRILLINLQPT